MSTKVGEAISDKARGFGAAVVEHLAVEGAARAVMCILPCCSVFFLGVPIAVWTAFKLAGGAGGVDERSNAAVAL
jgi:hypothetical protein